MDGNDHGADALLDRLRAELRPDPAVSLRARGEFWQARAEMDELRVRWRNATAMDANG